MKSASCIESGDGKFASLDCPGRMAAWLFWGGFAIYTAPDDGDGIYSQWTRVGVVADWQAANDWLLGKSVEDIEILQVVMPP